MQKEIDMKVLEVHQNAIMSKQEGIIKKIKIKKYLILTKKYIK
jgi:hypothetical protein